MMCWCSCADFDKFNTDYGRCVCCGTFVSNKQPESGLYDFSSYWHDRQINKYGFPPIEQRAKDDFNNRIPFWWNQLITLPKLNSILEIGAAHGGFLRLCKDNGFTKCVGVEVSEDTCSFARKTFDVEMICGEFPDIPIKGKFDIVCGFDVLEHLPDPLYSLKKMKKLSKYAAIQTPCYRNEGLGFPHFQADEHIFIFTEDSLKSLFGMIDMPIIHSVKGAFPNDIFVIGKSR